METSIVKLRPSELATLSVCPKSKYYKELDNKLRNEELALNIKTYNGVLPPIEDRREAPAEYGTIIHKLIQMRLEKQQITNVVALSQGSISYKRTLTEEQKTLADKYLAAIAELVPAGASVQTEAYGSYTFEHKGGTYCVHGTADIIVETPRAFAIWDIKTGRHIVNATDNLQLLTYLMIFTSLAYANKDRTLSGEYEIRILQEVDGEIKSDCMRLDPYEAEKRFFDIKEKIKFCADNPDLAVYCGACFYCKGKYMGCSEHT